jgi:hypothetical protein
LQESVAAYFAQVEKSNPKPDLQNSKADVSKAPN